VDFEQHMRNALIVGALRYGLLGEKGKPQYERMPAIVKRALEYQRTGDVSLLVDIANFALLEFVEGDHPLRHESGTDRTDHVQLKR